MKLMIDGGRWVVMSDDLRVHLQIQARRSLAGEPTRVLIRCEPMPQRVFEPETSKSGAHAAAWVWDGTPEHARNLVLTMLEMLKNQFQGLPADTAVGRWRKQVLNSLFPSTGGQAREDSESQRA